MTHPFRVRPRLEILDFGNLDNRSTLFLLMSLVYPPTLDDEMLQGTHYAYIIPLILTLLSDLKRRLEKAVGRGG